MMEVPAAAKVLTTRYDNFKGVDFTNDPTNVWRHRSPDAVNMLPDASGRPFKRKGWEVVVSAETLASLVGEATCEIKRCFYFELAGVDHIIIFTSIGVFKYAEDEASFLIGSDDVDCYTASDRAYFFEGGGKSAFYIYGNYKVWIYEYVDGEFNFKKETESVTDSVEDGTKIPRVLIATNPSDCTGTINEPYNMISNLACVEYTDNKMCFGRFEPAGEKTSFSFNASVFEAKLESVLPAKPRDTYVLEYEQTFGVDGEGGPKWKLSYSGGHIGYYNDIAEFGVTLGRDPVIVGEVNGDTVVVEYIYGCLLPNNVSQEQIGAVKVNVSKATQFDTPLDLVTEDEPPSETECVLHTDTLSQSEQAWIEFDREYSPIVPGEDCIRISFPRMNVTVTNYIGDDAVEKTVTASLIR